MRRPLVLAALSYIFGIALGYLLKTLISKIEKTEIETIAVIAIGSFVVALFLVLLFYFFKENFQGETFKYKKYFLIFPTILIFGVVQFYISYERLTIDKEMIPAEPITLTGQVEEVTAQDYEGYGNQEYTKYSLTIDVDKNDFLNGDIIASTYEEIDNPEKLVGQRVKVTGEIKIAPKKSNPNGFNYNLYLKTQGISALMEVEKSNVIQIIDEKNTIRGFLFEKKYLFSEKMEEVVGEDISSLFGALLFGDKSGLNEEDLEKFQKNGVMHILAVSGLHVSMVYGFCILIFGSIRKKTTSIMIFLILIAYGILADFTPSVMRAMVMIGTHMFANVFFYRYDMLTATAFSSFLLLLLNPLDLFSLGFQLSFGATAMLALLIETCKRRRNPKAIDQLLPIILLQVFMIPFTAYTFNYISYISIFANIPVVFIASFAVPIGLLCFIASFVFVEGNLLEFIFIPLQVVGEILFGINDAFFVEGFTSGIVTSPPLWFVVAFYLLLFLLLGEWALIQMIRKNIKKIVSIGLVCVLVGIGTGFVLTDNYKDVKYVFVDVGQGDCIHIKSEEGENILIDGGGSINYDVGRKILMPYLLKNGVRTIDLAIVTHLDTDHVGGIVSLAEEGLIEKVAFYQNVDKENKAFKTISENAKGVYLIEGDKIKVDKELEINIVAPSWEQVEKTGKGTDENNNSIVAIVEYGQEKLLLTGDIDLEKEEELLEQHNLASNIIKISHHGSKNGTGEEFLKAVNPQVAVFQVGENNHGHPSERVIELCQKNDIIIYRNDLDGAIRFYEDGKVLVTGGI